MWQDLVSKTGLTTMIYKKVPLYCSLLIAALFALPVVGQSFLDKPYSTWGREDALRIVTDSAWAKPYQSTSGSTAAAAGQVAREMGQSSTGGGSNPRSVARNFGPPPVTLRLHSALPMRQAIVRLQQLEIGYDKLNDADKAAFDKSRKGYLDCSICKEYYVVTLIRAADSSSQTGVEEGVFQGFTAADLKGNVRLVNDKGEERELIEFNAPKNVRDAAVFYFKRTDANDKVLITRESKELKLIFSADILSEKNRFAYLLPRTFEFKVSKLIHGDSVLF